MKKEKIILTGDRPTGRLHIGHYVGSLKRRVDLQDSGFGRINAACQIVEGNFNHILTYLFRIVYIVRQRL